MKGKSSRKSRSRRKSRNLPTLSHEESFNLPEEILEEILSRLPVKTLLKFRCVSKSLLSLISCPQFIKTHTRVSMENPKLSGHIAIFSDSHKAIFSDSYSRYYYLRQCSVHSLLYDPSLTDASNLDYPMKYAPNRDWVVGSCNGLICIFVDIKDFILWNPSTRKSKKLPSVDKNLKIFIHIAAYGFGFDECKDDYKVAVLLRLFEERSYKFIMMVYGLRTDSWKRVRDLEDTGNPLATSIKFASGKLHWPSSLGTHSDFRWEIICLDLESGVCGRLDQPDYGGSDNIYLTLEVLGGCLCVLSYEICTFDLWVLMEHGVKGSWTKLFHLPCIDFGGRFLFLKLLYTLPNGEILVIFGRSFILCNPTCGSFRVLEARKFDSVVIHLETLVSPAVKRRMY